LEKAKNRTGIRNINSQEVDDRNGNNDNSNDKLYSIGGFDGDPSLLSSVTSLTTNGASTKTNGASTNGSVVPSNGASINGSSAPANGASTNGSVAPVNGASVNGSVAPVNGASVNGSVAPVNGASVNGSVAPVNGAFVNGSVAPVNGSVAPVMAQQQSPPPPQQPVVVSESSSRKRGKGNKAIPGEIKKVQINAMLNSNLPEEPLEPLPFILPQITPEQSQLLANGERIQEQSKMGREGSGFVVLDVKAPPYAVWECLLDFEAYPKNIGTVRSMNMFTNEHLKSSYIAEKPVLPGTGRATRRYGNASITRAKFVLSKFRLNIAAIHKYRPHPDGHYMVFTLDRACTNAVLQDAKGIWYTQSNPDERGEEYTRVWLFCEVKVSPMLPSFIVDYAANRAMPRATTWLKPTVEAAAKEFLEQ
jgi:hypothetical protein